MGENAKAKYAQLENQRHSYLLRARDCARLTLPHLMTDDGDQSAQRLPTPYQSVGARGVNNLASALLLSLLPPNAPFFRFLLDSKAQAKLMAMSPNAKAEVETSLSELERRVSKEIESLGIRSNLFEAIKQLIVCGSVLLYFPDEGPMRVIKLDRFVVKRDPMGNAKRIIIKETVAPAMLPEEIQPFVRACMCEHENTVDIYTCCHTISADKVEVYQEVEGEIIPDSYGVYPMEQNPFLALRMNRVDGEDYGRSYVEQYLGDLISLESLSKSIVEAAAAASKVLFLVNPTGTTRAKTLAQAPNGAIREGMATDVSVLQVNKGQDLQVAMMTTQAISERLSYAFLLTEATIRNAERVTAEEVRLVTQSIERQLGGIYSILSQEFQLPLVGRIIDRLTKSKRMPKLPKNFVTPTIVTGIDALGRGNDLNRLDVYLQGIGQLLGPQMIQQYIDVREYMNRRAAALGIETTGLVKSEEQIAAEMQAQMQAQSMDTHGNQVMKSMTDMAKAQMQSNK